MTGPRDTLIPEEQHDAADEIPKLSEAAIRNFLVDAKRMGMQDLSDRLLSPRADS